MKWDEKYDKEIMICKKIGSPNNDLFIALGMTKKADIQGYGNWDISGIFQ